MTLSVAVASLTVAAASFALAEAVFATEAAACLTGSAADFSSVSGELGSLYGGGAVSGDSFPALGEANLLLASGVSAASYDDESKTLFLEMRSYDNGWNYPVRSLLAGRGDDRRSSSVI